MLDFALRIKQIQIFSTKGSRWKLCESRYRFPPLLFLGQYDFAAFASLRFLLGADFGRPLFHWAWNFGFCTHARRRPIGGSHQHGRPRCHVSECSDRSPIDYGYWHKNSTHFLLFVLAFSVRVISTAYEKGSACNLTSQAPPAASDQGNSFTKNSTTTHVLDDYDSSLKEKKA